MQEEQFITQLEAELEKSLKQREAAKKERERATLEEARWEQDVRALKNLISHRRNDAAHGGKIDSLQASAEGYSTNNDPSFVSGYEEVNRVEWAFEQIAKAGAAGMLPTEIYETAKKDGLSMHPNYPYVATKKLLERGRIQKIGKRYTAIEKEAISAETTS
jgi:hypothetical protein